MALLSLDNVHLSFGNKILLDAAQLNIERGERIGLLGRNGEGKSTLLSILTGAMHPDRGRVVRASGVSVSLLNQEVPSDLTEPVIDIIRMGMPNEHDAEHEVERICSLLNLDPDAGFASLSGGQKRRTLLGRALVAKPDLLLLDEPTNHLDIESIEWLESFLGRFPGSLLFVTHDRAFLQRLANRIIEIDRGRLTSWNCDYTTYLERKEAWLDAEEKQWAVFDKKLAQEEVWIRQGVKARRTRNEGRVRALKALRAERSQRRERVGHARIGIQSAERSGTKVIAAKEVEFTYPGAAAPLIRDFSTTLLRGDRVGIIGPNGCGKTTLLKLLLGHLVPDQGSITHGTSLQISYFDQHRHKLDEDRTVFDNVADGNESVTIDGQRRHVISYLQDFLFPPSQAQHPVKGLSGGERNRLLLARLFTRPSNVLVLDEPTNDLDAETLELLEARLLEYPGTVLVVSHDRRFLDNLCTSTFVFEGDGTIGEYVGGYSDWKRCITEQAKAAATPSPSVPENKPAARPVKLTNREREEWKKLPSRIEQLEKELARLNADMLQPEYFRKDPEAIREEQERARLIPLEIESAFERWAELDERK